MRLSAALGPLYDLRDILRFSMWPFLKSLWLKPSLLLHPITLRRSFFSHVWTLMGEAINEGATPVKTGLLADASGVVLEIGAGHGHTAHFLNRTKVSLYIALEPNMDMHDKIRENSKAAGFSEEENSLLILRHSAEDTRAIKNDLTERKIEYIDTMVCILSLCSVPNAENVTRSLVRDLLRPGGEFLYYEHVRSPRSDVSWWQDRWTPIWRVFLDGCELNRPTHIWIERMDCWKSKERWDKPDEPEENLFWHQAGRCVKA